MRAEKTSFRFINRISTLVLLLIAFTTFSYAEDPFEDDLKVESWITTLFETIVVDLEAVLVEIDLTLEEWMVTPFEYSLIETDLALENWMTIPFDNSLEEEELTLEPWMATPFDNSLEEEELILEPWMTAPFGFPAGTEMACGS